jgi:hypothetical protein
MEPYPELSDSFLTEFSEVRGSKQRCPGGGVSFIHERRGRGIEGTWLSTIDVGGETRLNSPPANTKASSPLPGGAGKGLPLRLPENWCNENDFSPWWGSRP